MFHISLVTAASVGALQGAGMACTFWLARRIGRRGAQVCERERIARALHDTLLQNMQATVLRLDAVAMDLPSGCKTRKDVETVLTQARQAIVEGRDQVLELRQEHVADLEQLAAETAREMREFAPGVQFGMTVKGERLPLKPQTGKEAAAIACEALRNAFRHAQADRVDLCVEYGRRQFQLQVTDNGSGIMPHLVPSNQRCGHWGMTGMRERAARLGAELRVHTVCGQGSTIMLAVPARNAYREVLINWLQRTLRRA